MGASTTSQSGQVSFVDRQSVNAVIVPASAYAELTAVQQGDSKKCVTLKESTANRIADRTQQNRAFTRQLVRRTATKPDEQIEIRVALPSIEIWDQVVPAPSSGVTITRFRYRIGETSGGDTFRSGSNETKFAEAVSTMRRSLIHLEYEVENRRKRVERARKNNPDNIPERLLNKLAQAEERLAAAAARIEELSTPSTLPITEVSLQGTPEDLVNHLGPESVYNGARYQDLTKSRKLVRRLMTLLGLDRKTTIERMKKDGMDHSAEVYEAPTADDSFEQACGS